MIEMSKNAKNFDKKSKNQEFPVKARFQFNNFEFFIDQIDAILN